MNLFLALGKLLTVLFWGVLLFTHLVPPPMPFGLAIKAVGAVLIVLHLVELMLCNGRLRERSHRGFDRLQILLTGAFHLLSIAKPPPRA